MEVNKKVTEVEGATSLSREAARTKSDSSQAQQAARCLLKGRHAACKVPTRVTYQQPSLAGSKWQGWTLIARYSHVQMI